MFQVWPLSFEKYKEKVLNIKGGKKKKRRTVWSVRWWDSAEILSISPPVAWKGPAVLEMSLMTACLHLRLSGLRLASDPKPRDSVHNPLALSHPPQLRRAACHCCHLSDKICDFNRKVNYNTPKTDIYIIFKYNQRKAGCKAGINRGSLYCRISSNLNHKLAQWDQIIASSFIVAGSGVGVQMY